MSLHNNSVHLATAERTGLAKRCATAVFAKRENSSLLGMDFRRTSSALALHDHSRTWSGTVGTASARATDAIVAYGLLPPYAPLALRLRVSARLVTHAHRVLAHGTN